MVYFWANNSTEKILNKEFKIKAGNGNDSLRLSTPPSFDFDDFFDFTFNKLDLKTHIDKKFHSTNEYSKIGRIVTSIKKSLWTTTQTD